MTQTSAAPPGIGSGVRHRALIASMILIVLCTGQPADVHAQNAFALPEPGVQPQPMGTTWQPLTLDFEGPFLEEAGDLNPFLDHRLDVVFHHVTSGTSYVVPGYFAADGQAAETGATAGTIWRVRFTPDRPGAWRWEASFQRGPLVAIQAYPASGTPLAFDGVSGLVQVRPADARAPGFLASGRIEATGETYWRSAGTGEAFLKLGANSPENFLGYVDFDQTPFAQHVYAAHLEDWSPGDPAWHGGQDGREIIGALNDLADHGMNAVYMLTFNAGGDGDDVWPWTSRDERLRFDCSKLDQWGIVLDHMDRLGLLAHLVLQETENDNEPEFALDGGTLGVERRLYHRELVARFGHKNGLVFNLGEENQNLTSQQAAFAGHLSSLDPYDHPQVLHTYPGVYEQVYEPLLQLGLLHGASLQVADINLVHQVVLDVRDLSLALGQPWAICLDEIGPPETGVVPDSVDSAHVVVRKRALWGALMAGAAGIEWYFGYAHPHDDLDCENWGSRASMWKQTRLAGSFFREHLPFADMVPADALLTGANGWCLAKPGDTYAVYLLGGGTPVLDLGAQEVRARVRWYDPRQGGELQLGSVDEVSGPGPVDLGTPPSGPFADWAVLVEVTNTAPTSVLAGVQPQPIVGPTEVSLIASVEDPDGHQDVVAVRFDVFTPDGTAAGSLFADPDGNGIWRLDLPEVLLQPAGNWGLVVVATDTAGHIAQGQTLFVVQ